MPDTPFSLASMRVDPPVFSSFSKDVQKQTRKKAFRALGIFDLFKEKISKDLEYKVQEVYNEMMLEFPVQMYRDKDWKEFHRIVDRIISKHETQRKKEYKQLVMTREEILSGGGIAIFKPPFPLIPIALTKKLWDETNSPQHWEYQQ